jgi:UDP:flavonoid glycosyltransferase YjiC (YdhE family)
MRALFCSFDSPGYLYPLVGLALELRARGHQVAFATNLPAAPLLEAVGLERIPRGEREGNSFRVNVHHAAIPIAIDVKHTEYAVERFGAEVMVTHQLCHAPHLARERKGIPVAVMGLFSFLYPLRQPTADSAAEATLQRVRRWRVAETVKVLNRGRALFRLPALDDAEWSDPLLGDLFMLRNVPELLPALAELPPRVHAVGACAWEPPGDRNAAWDALRTRFAEPDAPLLYVQHGRTFGGPGFWRQLVEALAGQPVQVAASLARMDGEMPHARAVVAGGHSSVVLGACTHGLPSVLVPSGVETPDNAHLLARAGCARVLEPQGLTPDALAGAVRDVMEDREMRTAARRVRQAFARVESFAVTAELVERLAETGAPVLREREPQAVAA